MEKLPWVEKYRPRLLDDVIDHSDKIRVLREMIKNRELPHLLFYGQPGSGKTSIILAVAREMFGNDYRQYILELNASDHRGIDIVRTVIPDFVKLKSDKIRLVILDEVDAMTTDAQSALRRVMEIYVKNSRFCLICNNITRIIPGVQSRCARMRFGTLQRPEVRKRVDMIVKSEGVRITDNAIGTLLAIHSDLRQVLNTLQCLHYINQTSTGGGIDNNNVIQPTDVYEYVGQPSPGEIDEIYRCLISNEGFQASYDKLLVILRENRWNFLDMIDHLCRMVIKSEDLNQRSTILKGLSEIEYRVVNGRDSDLQLASLIALFMP
jgi:replication factor C subunit 3/5